MSHRVSGLMCALTVLVAVASCSKSSPSAPGPSTPAPTPTSITVSSAGAHLFLGATETFTATVALSNGTVQPLTGGTWGTDAGAVATVAAATGVVTGVSSGEVTVFVDAQGLRGSKRITVLPNYAGIWVGSYRVTSCNQTGDWIDVALCGTLFATGAQLQVGFNLTQVGTAVSGRTLLGSALSNPFSTTAAANGGLTFQALAMIVDTAQGVNISVNQAWQINMTQAGRIDGTFVQTFTDPSATGQMVVGATLTGVVPGAAETHEASGGPRPRSIGELVAAALRGR